MRHHRSVARAGPLHEPAAQLPRRLAAHPHPARIDARHRAGVVGAEKRQLGVQRLDLVPVQRRDVAQLIVGGRAVVDVVESLDADPHGRMRADEQRLAVRGENLRRGERGPADAQELSGFEAERVVDEDAGELLDPGIRHTAKVSPGADIILRRLGAHAMRAPPGKRPGGPASFGQRPPGNSRT